MSDHEVTNDDRAAWAEGAIQKFIELTGTDREDALADLLCDLMHWADREHPGECEPFEAQLHRARYHYNEECIEAQEQEDAAA